MWKRAPVTTAILVVIAVVYVFEFIEPERLLEAGAIIPHLWRTGPFWRLLGKPYAPSAQLDHAYLYDDTPDDDDVPF